jgi:hypothetical protein
MVIVLYVKGSSAVAPEPPASGVLS